MRLTVVFSIKDNKTNNQHPPISPDVCMCMSACMNVSSVFEMVRARHSQAKQYLMRKRFENECHHRMVSGWYILIHVVSFGQLPYVRHDTLLRLTHTTYACMSTWQLKISLFLSEKKMYMAPYRLQVLLIPLES